MSWRVAVAWAGTIVGAVAAAGVEGAGSVVAVGTVGVGAVEVVGAAGADAGPGRETQPVVAMFISKAAVMPASSRILSPCYMFCTVTKRKPRFLSESSIAGSAARVCA